MAISIQYFGLSCFKITVKTPTAEVSLVTDPFDPSRGAKLPRNLAAEVVTVSHDHLSHNYVDAVNGPKLVVNGPGEFEVGGVFVYGISSGHGTKEKTKEGPNTIYRIETREMTLAHLGDLGHALTDKELEQLENVDVLFVPVGNAGVSIGAKDAVKIVTDLDPRIVIPMHFRLPQFKETLDPVDKFIKELGIKAETVDKLKLTKKDLPQEETKVYVMTIV